MLLLFATMDVEPAECGWESVNDLDLILVSGGTGGVWILALASSWWYHISAAVAADAAIETGWETTMRVGALGVRFDG